MKILVVGQPSHLEECRQKLGEHEYLHVLSHAEAEGKMADGEIVFDFLTSDHPESFSFYASKPATVFLNTWKVTIASLVHSSNHPVTGKLFGFNGFPTMFNRDYMEVTSFKTEDIALLQNVCQQLKTEYLRVEDRVGLVTPRVVCMIINEAYYTVQEGTATREDIDLAMKLGTNYPFGPFEWCERIGLRYVYELLQAVYDDTKDERYKISALMKKEYLAIR